jgi:flagellar hook-associated protein 3 FlgL
MRVSTNLMYTTGTNQMNSMQSQLLKLTQQAAVNQKVLVPSDDPVASARALDLSQSQGLNAQYAKNRQSATSALSHADSIVSQTTSILTDVRAMVIAAANGSYSNEERKNQAAELQGRLDQLVGFANEDDGMGNYLFSGFSFKTKPFITDQDGNITYQGDQGQRSLEVDANRKMTISISGSDLFQGNGEDMFKTMQELITALSTPATAEANKADAENKEATPEYVAYKAALDLLEETDVMDPAYAGYQQDLRTKEATWKAAEDKRTPVSGSLKDLYNKLGVAGTRIDNLMNSTGKITADIGAKLKELETLNTVGSLRDTIYTQEANDLLGRNPEDWADSISKLNLQKTYLEAAQKIFVSTTGLTLLNHL